MYKFELEKGSKKYDCPACSNKRFVRYVNTETSGHLSFDVGRCDREGKCGYHKKPKEYFSDNLNKSNVGVYVGTRRNKGISNGSLPNKNGSQRKADAQTIRIKPDYIDKSYLLRTLGNYEQNAFVEFLINLFPNSFDAVQKAVKDYRIGTTKTGKTVFWQIDQKGKIRTGKVIAYDAATGTRRKDVFPNWTHSLLKKKNLLPKNFNLKQCFFGTHLLKAETEKAVAVVEAEKTAVICSIFFPEYVWLGAGSATNLSYGKLCRFKDRQIVLFPDANKTAFDRWQNVALQARTKGLSVKVSNLVEKRGSDAEKANGDDLADYLIDEQIDRLEKQNAFANLYNAKLEKVLSDKKLLTDAETILDEQLAVLIVGGKLSEPEAENRIMNFDNLREIVLSV